MPTKFDFISATDKPALLAFSTPEWLEAAKSALVELGYKVHTAATHTDFLIRFSQAHYQVVILEELFAANDLSENLTLQALQSMPMSQRPRDCHSLRQFVSNLHTIAGFSAERSCRHQCLRTVSAQT